MEAGSRTRTGLVRARRRAALALTAGAIMLGGSAWGQVAAGALSVPSTTVPGVSVPTATVPTVTVPTVPATSPVTLLPVTSPTLPSVGGTAPGGGILSPVGSPAGPSGAAQAPTGGAGSGPAATAPSPCPASGCGAAPGPARTTSAGAPGGSSGTGGASADSLVRRSLRDAAGAGFPLGLALLGMLYLLVQGRIDRRDPKLAAASLRGDRWAPFGGERPSPEAPGRGADGLVSLDERLRSMELARGGLAALALVLSATLTSGRPSLPRMLAVTIAYGLVAGCAGGVWRALRRRSLPLLGAIFTLDGVFLAWLVLVTGGVGSPLQYLVPLYVATVALLASYRTGVRVAVWNSVLAVGAFYGSEASLLPGSRPPGPGGFARLLVFVVVLWVTAVVTATFSAVNERELRRRRYRLEVLHRLALDVQAAPTVEGVAAAAVDAAVEGLGLRRALVVAGRDGHLSLVAHRGAAEGSPPDQGPSGDRIFRAGTGTVLQERIDPGTDPWAAGRLPGATGVIVVPLVVADSASGAVVLEHGGSRVDRGLLATLEQMVSHAALAIGNRWLLERIEAQASTDGLTGLANRRSFDATIERETVRARRSGGALSLVLVDIDHFKRVNDEYGHATGDEVLRLVAGMVRSVVRPYDVVARYGGEEIAVVLPGCAPGRARRTAERLRAAVARADSPVPVTVSAGVASLGALEDPEGLLRRADAALYRSKRGGRNRVTFDDGPARVVRFDRPRRTRRAGSGRGISRRAAL